MIFSAVRPLLFRFAPETAHRLTIVALKAMPRRAAPPDAPSLGVSLWGRRFPNPIGLAAGFDKNAEVFSAILSLGFGFTEVGTVTPRAQAGNPRPRLFRLVEDEAVINRLGFNNQGHAPAYERLNRGRGRLERVGVNVGANKDSADRIADYTAGIETFCALAGYFTINISSPNTPGLRDLQARASLDSLIRACQGARGGRQVPILVKIAPDLDDAELADVAAVALETGVDGLIIGNTTLARPASLKSSLAVETGGLSGQPLMALSTDRLRFVYGITGRRLPLIGVGGIASGADAYAKIRAGASLVQLYSALVYQGPGLVRRIKSELAALLARDGFACVADAVGTDGSGSRDRTGDLGLMSPTL